MPGSVKMAVVATETAKAMFALGSYARAYPRLAALTWGAEDLAAARNRQQGARRRLDLSYQVARAQCIFAASAAGVAPIDTIHADFRDLDGLDVISHADAGRCVMEYSDRSGVSLPSHLSILTLCQAGRKLPRRRVRRPYSAICGQASSSRNHAALLGFNCAPNAFASLGSGFTCRKRLARRF